MILQPVKAHHNFRNKLFDSVEVQRNSTTAKCHFGIKSKRNLPSAIRITRHNSNTHFYDFRQKQSKSFTNKNPDVHQYYDRNETKLSLKYGIMLLTPPKN